jgi:hypothetical protein
MAGATEWLGSPVGWRAAPYHPNLPGMQAVADLLTARALVN